MNENQNFERYGIKKPYKEMTFETFNVDSNLQVAFRICKEYANNFRYSLNFGSDAGNLFLIDRNPGSGKTHLACAIANDVSKKSIDSLLVYIPDFLANVTPELDSMDGILPDIKHALIRVPLLIIDDIGFDTPTKWQLEVLYKVIHSRVAYYKPMIVTSKRTPRELREKIDPLLITLIEDGASVVSIDASNPIFF